MTAFDQFDPFERRIAEAIDEIAAARPPAYLDDVLQRTARTAQRARWAFPERWIQMNRTLMAAAMTLVVVVLAAGVYLGLRPVSGPSATPQPTLTPTPSAAAATPAALPPVSELKRSTWVAETAPAASPGERAPLTQLLVTEGGNAVSITDGGNSRLFSSLGLTPGGELQLTSTSAVGGCQVGDVGRYRFAFGFDGLIPNTDGTQLALPVIADACAARQTALDRAWFHSIDFNSAGGRGISTAFSPMFLITLPPASYTADVGVSSVTEVSATPDRTLFAVYNPLGWTNPCLDTGATRTIDPTIAAFSAYMKTLPGFTVQSKSLTIDGHPAAQLIVPSVSTTDCPTNRVYEWTDGPGGGGWFLTQGDTDVIYLVEVEGKLVLLQWLGEGVTRQEEQALFATIRFTDTLPQ